MGGHKSELFKGTLGSGKPKNVSSNSNLPAPAPVALSTGNTIRDNLHDAMAVVPLKKSGYFAEPSRHKGRKSVRVFASDNPEKTAFEFASKVTKNYVSLVPIKGKGFHCVMRDGSNITYRWVSSSKDKSPVVELTISNLKRVKNQKIHFIKDDRNGISK